MRLIECEGQASASLARPIERALVGGVQQAESCSYRPAPPASQPNLKP